MRSPRPAQSRFVPHQMVERHLDRGVSLMRVVDQSLCNTGVYQSERSDDYVGTIFIERPGLHRRLKAAHANYSIRLPLGCSNYRSMVVTETF